MDKRKKIIIVIVLAIALLCVGVYLLIKNGVFESAGRNDLTYGNFVIKDGNYGELEIYDTTMYVEGYQGSYDKAFYIYGNIKNNGTKNCDFLVITFDLFDKDGNNLGVAVAGVENVKANKEYDFKAMSLTTTIDANKIVSYKLQSILDK